VTYRDGWSEPPPELPEAPSCQSPSYVRGRVRMVAEVRPEYRSELLDEPHHHNTSQQAEPVRTRPIAAPVLCGFQQSRHQSGGGPMSYGHQPHAQRSHA
jgi:hypothetical protein